MTTTRTRVVLDVDSFLMTTMTQVAAFISLPNGDLIFDITFDSNIFSSQMPKKVLISSQDILLKFLSAPSKFSWAFKEVLR
jgi:hypothetical protein